MNDIIGYVTDPSYFQIWGLSGTAVIFAGCAVAAFFYKGRDGEKYNPLNHFISELGEKGISKLALFFNLGLMIGGILDSIFMIQLGRYIGTPSAVIFSVLGVISSLACLFVGIFPMNNIVRHTVSATIFFYGGMFSVILFSITSFLDKTRHIQEVFSIFAIAVAAVFFAFLTIMRFAVKKGFNLDVSNIKRPAFWLYPLVEWCVMISISIWIIAVSASA